MSYRLLRKSKRFLEFSYKYHSNLLRQRLRGPGARTIRVLIVSADEGRTNEAQFDPFWIDSSRLRERLGVVVRWVSIDQALRKSPAYLRGFDVVGLQFFFRTPAGEVMPIIEALRSRSGPRAKLVYFDGDDDLGILWPQILKKVDLYVKNQLSTDRTAYLRSTIGKTNLTEYVANHYGFSFEPDPIPRSVPVADGADLEKLFLGWNLGASRAINKLFKRSRAESTSGKDIDAYCRVSFWPPGWVAHLRNDAIRHMEPLAAEYRVVATADSIPPAQFQGELRRSRICVSPFGHGEVCFRDFEAVLHGCLLVKPDMAHLESRPNLYVPGETYVPIRWDYSDLAEKCRYYLENESERARIADRATRALREFHEKHGFVDIFAQLVDQLGLWDGDDGLAQEPVNSQRDKASRSPGKRATS
jgi:hypothetical protein